jgi:hypothetical protein
MIERPGEVWNAQLHRWQPAGATWDRWSRRWVAQPELVPAEPERVELVPEPAVAKQGPRRCPQRNRYKRQLSGPRARQPTRSGVHAPGLSTLPRRTQARVAQDREVFDAAR